MQSASLLEVARDIFARRIHRTVLGLGAIGLSVGMFAASANAQQYYQPMPHGGYYPAPQMNYYARPVNYAGHGHGYAPCPSCNDCPPGRQQGSSDVPSTTEPTPEGSDSSSSDFDVPEVGDLNSDVSYASASQSAAPNSIGDSLNGGAYLHIDGINFDVDIPIAPGGGRRYKAASNNSAVPQARVYYNYQYFDEGQLAQVNQVAPPIAQSYGYAVQRHEFGVEYPFWCNLASVQVIVPISNGIGTDINLDSAGVFTGLPSSTQLGNISVAFKGVLLQDCNKTISAGVGVNIPTAEDITVVDVAAPGEILQFENEAVTVSPYLAALLTPSCDVFLQGFAQIAVPVSDNEANGYTIAGVPLTTTNVSDQLLLYLDGSIGYWLSRDACGNGVAAMAELHYTKTIGNNELVPVGILGGGYATTDYDLLNATAGLAIVNNNWTITPAMVLPLLETPDRSFDWEATVQVNRRF